VFHVERRRQFHIITCQRSTWNVGVLYLDQMKGSRTRARVMRGDWMEKKTGRDRVLGSAFLGGGNSTECSTWNTFSCERTWRIDKSDRSLKMCSTWNVVDASHAQFCPTSLGSAMSYHFLPSHGVLMRLAGAAKPNSLGYLSHYYYSESHLAILEEPGPI
jgi:hypothetical protein